MHVVDVSGVWCPVRFPKPVRQQAPKFQASIIKMHGQEGVSKLKMAKPSSEQQGVCSRKRPLDFFGFSVAVSFPVDQRTGPGIAHHYCWQHFNLQV